MRTRNERPGKSLAALAAKAIEAAGPRRSGPPSSAGIAVPSADDLRKELFAGLSSGPRVVGSVSVAQWAFGFGS